MVVVVLVYIVAAVAEVRVLIGERVLVIVTPAVLAVGGAGTEALPVAIVDRLPQQVRSVLIDFVVGAAAVVAINRSGVEVGIVVVIVAVTAQPLCLLPLALVILLLKAVLCHAPLLLQRGRPLLGDALLLVEMLAILHNPLLLLPDQLLLLLL